MQIKLHHHKSTTRFATCAKQLNSSVHVSHVNKKYAKLITSFLHHFEMAVMND